jgi:hypothetical protein
VDGRGVADESRRVRWLNAAAILLGAVGLLQMAGELVGSRALKGIGAASAVAPLPKVSSDVGGVETLASEFTFEIDGGAAIPITPDLYRRLAGPYNRRNVYGAALADAPRLPPPLWEAVLCYGLSAGGPLRSELGLPPAPARVSVRIRTKTGGRTDSWLLAPPCSP